MWAEQAVCGWELLESDLRLNKRSFPALLLRFIWGHLSGCHPSLRLFQEVVSLRRWGWAFGRCALISPHKGHGALCPRQTPTTLGTWHWALGCYWDYGHNVYLFLPFFFLLVLIICVLQFNFRTNYSSIRSLSFCLFLSLSSIILYYVHSLILSFRHYCNFLSFIHSLNHSFVHSFIFFAFHFFSFFHCKSWLLMEFFFINVR